CLQHNCKLCDRCPHCDSSLKAISDFSVPGYCNRCRHWLGKTDYIESSLQQDFIVRNIGDLIALAPQLNYQPNLKNLKQKFKLILFCFERAIHQDLSQYVVLIKLIEKLKIDLKQNYSKPMNLTEVIIPVCQQSKISISQLFKSDYDNLAQILAQNLKTDYKIL
ncbi:MAG: TniQ family protein, partial [Waterburya sp.]